MERLDTAPLRGLIRGSALDTTSFLRMNEFEGYGSDHNLMVELALAGEFRFVERPLYYKRLHDKNYYLKWQGWPEERKRAAWSVLAAWMIEAIAPRGRSLDERRQLFDNVLERFLMARGWFSQFGPWAVDRLGGWTVNRRRKMFCQIDNNDAPARAAMLQAILERLRSDGRFDVAATLSSDWDAVADAARRRFA